MAVAEADRSAVRPAGIRAAPVLELRGLVKRYGSVVAAAGIDLAVGDGEFVALLGPSGCGKTTVLRCIAGIVEPEAGEVVLAGENICGKPIYARDTALVFQNYALFPHLSVFENVAFGLRMRRVPKPELRARVAEALDLVRLSALEKRLPGALSGGQQQRVALARALVVRPTLLLLDEPLSNLDARLREEMRGEIRRLQRTLGVAAILVTHDIEEAFSVADRIAVMREGRIEQMGAPAEIYGAPATRFVADFVGHANIFDATVRGAAGRGVRLGIEGGIEIEAPMAPGWRAGDRAWAIIPPERIRLGAAALELDQRFEAEIKEVTYLGGTSRIALRVGAVPFMVASQNAATGAPGAGERVMIGWERDDVIARSAAERGGG